MPGFGKAQITRQHGVGPGERQGPKQHGFEFMQVARPGVCPQQGQGVVAELAGCFVSGLPPEQGGFLDKAFDAFAALVQGGDSQIDDRKHIGQAWIDARFEIQVGIIPGAGHPPQRRTAQRRRGGTEFDPIAQAALNRHRQLVDLVEPDRYPAAGHSRPASVADALAEFAQRGDTCAAYVEKDFFAVPAEGVDIARKESAAGPLFTPDQDGNLGKAGVQSVHPLGQVQVAEPATETLAKSISVLARGEGIGAVAPNSNAQGAAKRMGAGGVGQGLGVHRIKEQAHLAVFAGRRKQQPGAIRKAATKTVDEFQLLFKVARESQHHRVRGGGPGEKRVPGPADHGTVSRTGNARERVAVMGISVDDPDRQHGSRSAEGLSQDTERWGGEGVRTNSSIRLMRKPRAK